MTSKVTLRQEREEKHTHNAHTVTFFFPLGKVKLALSELNIQRKTVINRLYSILQYYVVSTNKTLISSLVTLSLVWVSIILNGPGNFGILVSLLQPTNVQQPEQRRKFPMIYSIFYLEYWVSAQG